MDKIQEIVANFLSVKFEDWKPYLTEKEQAVFILFYFKGKKLYEIGLELNYSQRHIRRILKTARNKIYKILP